jgi:hypothetical protein
MTLTSQSLLASSSSRMQHPTPEATSGIISSLPAEGGVWRLTAVERTGISRQPGPLQAKPMMPIHVTQTHPAASIPSALVSSTENASGTHNTLTNATLLDIPRPTLQPKSIGEHPSDVFPPLVTSGTVQAQAEKVEKTVVRTGLTTAPTAVTKGYQEGGGLVMLQQNYWPEVEPVEVPESTGAPGNILRPYPSKMLWRGWKKAKNTARQSFQQYVRGQLLKGKTSLKECNTIYLRQEELGRIHVTINDGILKRHKNPIHKGTFIFTLTHDNKLYVTTKKQQKLGRIQHSSLSHGEAVRSAGMISIDNQGKITEIEAASGHYHPGDGQVANILYYLREQGIGLSTFNVKKLVAKGEVAPKEKADIWLNRFEQGQNSTGATSSAARKITP